MAPEQSRDPLAIDGRADIYALGGTFYNLITGLPPFSSEHAVELIRKHREWEPVPPTEFVPGLPSQVSDVIRTMMGKNRDERYPNMVVVVDVLEGLLGLRTDSAARDLVEAGRTARNAADALADSPARRLKFRVLGLSGAIWLGFALLLAGLGMWSVATALLAMGATTTLSVMVVAAVTHRSELGKLLSALILSGGFVALATTGLIALAILIAVLAWGSCFFLFLILCVGGLVGAFHVFLDRPLAVERRQAVQELQTRLQQLRSGGHDELALQKVIATEGGPHGDELFEMIFGHRALVAARLRWRTDESTRKIAPLSWLRDHLYSVLEELIQNQSDRQHLRILQDAEEGRLQVHGMNLLTARRKARRVAKAMSLTTAQWRDEQRLLGAPDHSPSGAASGLLERLVRAADQPEPVLEPQELQPSPLRRRIDSLAHILLGRGLRFILGGTLVSVFILWLDASGIITAPQVAEQAAEVNRVIRKALETSDLQVMREVHWTIPLDWKRLEEPVHLPGHPAGPAQAIHGADLAVASALLLFSSVVSSRFTGLFALCGSVVVLLGPRWGLFIPAISERLAPHAQTRILGLFLVILPLFLPRPKAQG
jgi:hypothetical protein